MTRKTRVIRTIGAAVLAVGISAQAAQAKPFELPPGGVLPNAHALSQHATSRALPWSPARMHESGASAVSPHTGVQSAAGTSATQTAPVARPDDGVNWAAIAGGVAIVGVVGALGIVAFRLRPGRTATA